MTEVIGFGSAVAAALVYAMLALWHLGRRMPTVQQRVYGVAFATTAAWLGVTLAATPGSPAVAIAESARNLLWLTFVLLLFQREGELRRAKVVALYALLAAGMLLTIGLAFAPMLIDLGGALATTLFFLDLALRILVIAGGFLLLHNLYEASASDMRWGVRGPLVAIALMWLWDLNLYTLTYLTGHWPDVLVIGRGMLMLALVLPFTLASRRRDTLRLSLSRTAAFQTVSLLAIGGYLVFMVVATRGMALIGGENARTAQVALVLIMSVAAALLLPSARVRAWLRVVIAKNFFQHRYDYREEWLRFTGTLGRPGDRAAPLESRVIKAIADITESPGGLLLVPEENAASLAFAARWQWAAEEPPRVAGDIAFAEHVEDTGRILELDVLRSEDPAHDAERALTPAWLLDEAKAWIAVPLIHLDRLAGVVVVERPPADRLLDWEDFDLLKVAGRQAASYLAEARVQEALSEASRFDEFNRRFAFILHDIKNLVSQLSLVARNAERHADKPEFRADMVATLQSSVGKMNALLALLSQQSHPESAAARPLPLGAFVRQLIEARRDANPLLVDTDDAVTALADPTRLEQALIHVVQNAIDASLSDQPVRISVRRRGDSAVIEVVDTGRGMSRDFIRTGLFKPFASTKVNGFGVGAFESRALLAAMGGALEVDSKVGEGSCFTLVLPLAGAPAMAAERQMRIA